MRAPKQQPGRPEAAQAIWHWRDEETAAGSDAADSGARARLRGVIQAAAGAAVGAALMWFGHRIPGTIVLGIAGVILLAALASPTGLFAAIERGFLRLGQLLGRALAWLMLVPLFYLFFMPFGKLFRRGRRDLLKRYYDPEADTYWEKIEGRTAPSGSLERQY